MKKDLLEYAADYVQNRETFLLHYGADFENFALMIKGLYSVWDRLGNEKDPSGHSHVSLIFFVNLLVRHAIFGFQHLVSYQSFLAWLTFRPGLEAFLMLGRWVDDPNNAKIWEGRKTNYKAYKNIFFGTNLISKSFPMSSDFQKVLNKINDDFMHPNPDFTFREHHLEDQGDNLFLKVEYFDSDSILHEAHLLAFLNLLDEILLSSKDWIEKKFGQPTSKFTIQQPFSKVSFSRADSLARQDAVAKKIMEELGLFKF